jgi:uncharacterized protein (TIGR02996 family)
MATEQRFLDAIESQPEDRSVRLVYADWLEERGDPNGELIRIEEEMRSLPAYSDRYWQLKPRRNALRQACDKEWLQRLKYGTDYQPVFREVPDGWKERWRLLREFTERWHGVPVGDVGRHQREIEEAERQLKVKLPPAVREWIAYSHDLMERESFGILRDNYAVSRLKGFAAVSLLLQSEGDVYWAVRNKNLNLPDPPVDWYGWDRESAEDGRFVHGGSYGQHVTSFVFRHLSAYLPEHGGRSTGTRVQAHRELLQQLAEAFPVQCQFDHCQVFERPNMIVRLTVTPPDPSAYLRFNVWEKVPRSEVPAFLWNLVPWQSLLHGISTPRST